MKPMSGELVVFNSSSYPQRGSIGYIPQRLGLINHETVYFNVLEGAICNESILRSLKEFPISISGSGTTHYLINNNK